MAGQIEHKLLMASRMGKIQEEMLGISRGAIVAAIAFFCLVVILVLHRHYAMSPAYASFDQGIFNQVFWNGIHGRPFQSSLSSTLSAAVVQDGQLPEVFYHRLGQHFTPALLLWLPIYALFPHAVTLFVLQVALITAAGLVLYRLARQHLQPSLATLITVSFYAANAVIGPTLANFHDLSQLPLFLFGLFLALEKRCWWAFAILAGLVLIIREDAGVALFSVGFYLVLSRRYPRIGLAVCVASLTYMLVLTNLVMPLFSEDISRRFMIEQFGSYVDSSEASTLDIIWAISSQPGQIIISLFTPLGQTVKYLLGHWLPLAFIPALSVDAWLLAAFPLLKIFLRDDPTALSINLRYALTVVPALFYGTILWWGKHPGAFKQRWRRLWVACIGLSLFFTLTSNPNRTFSFLIPDSIQPRVYISLPRQWQHARQIYQLTSQIPPDASVSATTHIVPHLSSRREIVRFPALRLHTDAGEDISVDYAIVDLWQLQQYQVAFADDRNRLRRMVPAINRVLERDRYGLVGFEDGVLLMRLNVASNPEALAAWRTYRQDLQPILQPNAPAAPDPDIDPDIAPDAG